MFSARNVLKASVCSIKFNDISALITTKINNKILKAHITKDSLDELYLKNNDNCFLIFKASSVIVAKNECAIKTSAANELSGKITNIQKGSINALLCVDCNGICINAMISLISLENMNLKINDNVNVLIKASNVLLGINDG